MLSLAEQKLQELDQRENTKLMLEAHSKIGAATITAKSSHLELARELLDQSSDWSKHDRSVREKLQEKICKLEADVFEAIFKDGFESHKKAFLAISQAKTNIMCYYAAHFTVK